MTKTLEDIKGMKLKVGDIIEVKGLDEHEKLVPWEHVGYFVGCYHSYYGGHHEIVITDKKGKISFFNETGIAFLSEKEPLPMDYDAKCIKLDYINKITKMVVEE